jgi:predicted ATPase
VHDRFETQRGGQLQLAGAAGATVPVHRLGTEQASGPRRTDEHTPQLTEYTGRHAELGTLLAAFDRACAGEGQMVTVVGEAGAGKSRLLHEFRARQREGAVRFVRGHCESYGGGGRPYLPFVDALHELFALDSRSDTEARQARLLSELHAIDPQLEQFAPFYLHLLSLPSGRHPLPHQLQGEQFRTAMREALAGLLTLVAERQPLVLILEDWHWADEASHEVLKQLAAIIAPYPMLVLVAYRPGYGAEWDGTLPRTLIQLGPLGVADAARMVETMVGAPVADGVAPALHDRSGGNPFFLEELCHSLQEAGMLRVVGGHGRLEGATGELHLPTTIQGVIRTRLDRLQPATREVVRSAAVLGREFTYPLLERLGHDRYALERSLDTLKQLGILQQLRVVPERTFRFKHALMQEVAYDTLLQHRRRVLHGQAGRAMEALFAGQADDHAGRLAYHFSRAEEWLQAVRHGRTAAERERALSEFQDALSTLEAVAGWIAHLPQDADRRQLEIETLLQQEELCETLGMRRRQQEILDRLAELVQSTSDPRLLIEVRRRRGDVCTLLRRFDEARAELDAALDLARRTRDDAAQSHVLRSLGLTAWHQRRTAEALMHAEEALRLDVERGDRNAIIADLANKAQILKDLDRHDEALACLERAVELLESAPSSLKMSYVLHNMANIHRIRGEPEQALEYLRRASELSERSRLPVQWSFHLTAIAHIQLTLGRSEDAVQTYRQAVEVARRARYAEGLAQSLRPLGEVLAGIGREAEALPYLREAAELFAQLGDPTAEAAVWRRTAEAAEAIGDGSALHAWERCRGIAEQVGDAALQLDALEGIARLRRAEPATGAAHARAALGAALELARSTGDRRREGALLNSLAILDWEQGAYANAAERYAAALEIFRALDDRVHAGLILNSLGATLRALGRSSESRIRLDQALTMNRVSGQRRLEGHSLALLGELCMDAGSLREACELFAASLEVRRAIGDRRGEGWMHCRLASALARERRPQESLAHLDAARTIAAELGDRDLIAECGGLVAT